eukprot:scaffold7449_cov185-Ochromonas_danica.AAC.1
MVGPDLANTTASLTLLGVKSTARERLNAYIHLLYIKKDFNECLRKIEEQLKASQGQSEYALYVK